MKSGTRHFRSRWWFDGILLRGINMAINNVWSMRKTFGIEESVQNVRELIADQFCKDLKKEFEKQTKHKSSLSYLPMHFRCKKKLDRVRLDGHSGHYPKKLKGVYRHCVVHRNGSKTNNFCKRCKVHVHRGKCYQSWHTKLQIP